MSLPHKILLAAALFAAILLGGQSAFATSYTLSGPVVITDAGGNSITLTGVSDDLGTQNYLAGVAGSDLFIFDVEVTAGDFEELDASLLIATAVGIGYYSDGETAPSSGSIVGSAGQFDYDAPNITGDGNRLFLSFNGFVLQSSASFMVQSFGELIVSGSGGITEIPPIPEPGTLALSALGLVGLAAAGRRRRS
jgi:PEP-CTERM motif